MESCFLFFFISTYQVFTFFRIYWMSTNLSSVQHFFLFYFQHILNIIYLYFMGVNNVIRILYVCYSSMSMIEMRVTKPCNSFHLYKTKIWEIITNPILLSTPRRWHIIMYCSLGNSRQKCVIRKIIPRIKLQVHWAFFSTQAIYVLCKIKRKYFGYPRGDYYNVLLAKFKKMSF